VLHLASYTGPHYDGVPAIGEHTGEVLTELLALSADELAALAASGVVKSA
jgi:crotonobetainyl-CoA:carnitine CoA-transferase CaiB-like acyl-CoA transferase